MRESFGIRVYKEYFNFGAAHFLIFGDGGREQLHGHNYRVRVEVWGDTSEGDLVIDFIKFKPLVKQLCDDLDHRTLLPRYSPHLTVEVKDDRVEARHTDGSYFCFPRNDVRVLDITNTSTEMLAQFIAKALVEPLRETGAVFNSLTVEVEETLGQCGIYRLDVGD